MGWGRGGGAVLVITHDLVKYHWPRFSSNAETERYAGFTLARLRFISMVPAAIVSTVITAALLRQTDIP